MCRPLAHFFVRHHFSAFINIAGIIKIDEFASQQSDPRQRTTGMSSAVFQKFHNILY